MIGSETFNYQSGASCGAAGEWGEAEERRYPITYSTVYNLVSDIPYSLAAWVTIGKKPTLHVSSRHAKSISEMKKVLIKLSRAPASIILKCLLGFDIDLKT